MTFPDDAACAGMDTNLFVIDDKRHGRNGIYSSPHTRIKLANALALCRTCPVQQQCLQAMQAWPDPPRDIVIANLQPRDARRAWFDVNTVTHHHTTRTV
jgi:hypothetical protein